MNEAENHVSRFKRDGFAIFPEVVSSQCCDELAGELTRLFETQQPTARKRIGGIRNLLQTNKLVAKIADCSAVKSILTCELGMEAFPVRAIFFDKTPQSNWKVGWHQDLQIAVAEKIEAHGFGPWSVKAGVPHVQPPVQILERLVTIRLHLDDCDADNGSLKVIARSHAAGVLAGHELEHWKRRQSTVCEVPKGGVLLMRPLLLHASSPARKPKHRRVLHMEYATDELPNGLRWLERQ